MTELSESAAQRLLDDHDQGRRFSNVTRDFGITDLSAAYDVQDRLVAMLRGRRGEACGYKIGLTSKSMQEMCNIDQPICGVVFADGVVGTEQTIALSRAGRIGLEFEIAVRMGRDLGGPGQTVGIDDVAPAMDGVAAAFEMIDDRNADYGDLDVLSLIADNSWSAGCVLGSFVEPPGDLAEVLGTVELNGEVADQGHGRAALGHPHEPVRWLANHLSLRGGTLRAGDVVLTGSLVRTLFPSAGDNYRFSVSDIGAVSVSFSP